MITSFNKLNVYYKTALLSLFVGVVLTLALMFLFFIGQSEIILGLILGLLFGTIIYMINGIIEQHQGYRLSVAFIFTRLILLIGFMVGMALLYYKGNVHLFNVIAIAGGYFISEVLFIVLHLRERK